MHTAEEWDRAYAGAELRLPVEPHPQLAAELGGLPPGRGLELACGEGRPSIWLARLGWTMTAVDFSAVAIERGRQIARTHGVEVDWRVADVTRFDPPDRLDLVVVEYVHLAREVLLDAVGRAAGALAPGGTLLVLGWDRCNAAEGTGGPRPVELLYDLDELAAAAGTLRLLRAERIAQPGSPARDALLVARRDPA